MQKYLNPNQNFKIALKKALIILNLSSQSYTYDDYDEIISDLVLLRDVIAHYNFENSKNHFSYDLKYEIEVINNYLHITTTNLIINNMNFVNNP